MGASRIFCPSCGAENRAQDRFCTACGSALPAAPPPVVEVRQVTNRWPLLITMGVVFVLLMLVVAEAVIILLPEAPAREVGATLSVVEGKVFVQEGGQGDWMEVTEDFVVQAGDRIRVGGGSLALLTFLEGTSTDLRAFTELTVAQLQLAEGQPFVTGLDLEMGEIWNRIGDLPADSIHEVTTAAAKVVAHGTEYGAAVDEQGTTWLTGHEGVASVSGGGQTVDLGAGQMLVVEPGMAPEPFSGGVPVPTTPVDESAPPATCGLSGIDLPTFLNEPLPTTTPTSTPTATREPTKTATATSTATPTATATRPPCPTLSIKVPSSCYPRRACGLEWDSSGPIPGGYEFGIEYSADEVNWTRLAVPLDPYWYQEGGHFKAVINGPGAGTWYWRICLVSQSDLKGPSECCGPSHAIIHSRDEGSGDEGDDRYDY